MVHSSLVALAQALKQAAGAGRAARPRKAAMELTESAVARIRELLQQRQKVGGAGCRACGGERHALRRHLAQPSARPPPRRNF